MMDPSWQMCHCARHVRTETRDGTAGRAKRWMLMSIALRVINVLEKLFFKIFFFMILIWFCYDFVMFCSWLIL